MILLDKLSSALIVSLSLCTAWGQTADSAIDREAVVARHRVITTANQSPAPGDKVKTSTWGFEMPDSPTQVGNGHFAFGVDITGLQTFVPYNTMSDWSWHSFPLPAGVKVEDYEPTLLDTHGRMVPYLYPDPKHPEISTWLAGNPHRFNLGRMGLRMLKADGLEATVKDIQNVRQETDLWTGIITSTFTLEGQNVKVRTACHPDQDEIGVSVESELIQKGRLSLFIDFPAPNHLEFANYVGDYDHPQAHRSTVTAQSDSSLKIARQIDDTDYTVVVGWSPKAEIVAPKDGSSHRFQFKPTGNSDCFELSCLFAKSKEAEQPPTPVNSLFSKSKQGWKDFWTSGAAVDFSASKDPRWFELERRIVLSQYLVRVNEAGDLPYQENGLVNNGWYGRHHFEMIWWHGVHYIPWNRWELLDRSLGIYQKFLPTSIERAKAQGYKGARWPKCTANFDRDWPHPIHATLIWQQPHPIYFAEADYRLHPTQATLEKWRDVVFNTADFMADFAFLDVEKGKYVLGPPVYIVSENTDNLKTQNPAYELSAWRYGLRVALKWRERLGLDADPKWKEVLENLSPLPTQDGVYVTHEGIQDMWTKFAYEHPALIGTCGALPGDGVEPELFKATLEKVIATWNFEHVWGWDFPMLAMAAARNGKPEKAVDFLLHKSSFYQFDEHGFCTGGPIRPYFPSSTGLLAAVGMMVGGWDGSSGEAPGFPKDGSWTVKAEGFVPMQ